MGVEVNIETNADNFAEQLDISFREGLTGLQQAVGRAALKVGRKIHDNAQQRFSRNSTGFLRADFLVLPIVVRQGQTYAGSVGSPKKYAAIQDDPDPTTVRPRVARVLSIPVSERTKQRPVGPRDFRGYWRTINSPKARVGFFERDTGDLLFVGVESVTIRGNKYAADAVEAMEAEVLADLGGVIDAIAREYV